MDRLRTYVDRYGDRTMPAAIAANALAMMVFLIGPRLLNLPLSHRYLVWNLALAWIPYVAAFYVQAMDRQRRHGAMVMAAVVWLLFLPNAPYLVSDFTHLQSASASPWLDLSRFAAFAWAGCLMGVASVVTMQKVVQRHAGTAAGWIVVAVAAIASGVGIALGRFARLNSWEMVTRPGAVLTETVRLAGSPRAISVAAFFALFVLVVYAGVRSVASQRLP